jgi:GntR family transcriptional regulator/MocR family aminotransferase
MLTYSFDTGSGETLYEQLYRFLRHDIATGALAADTRLPSKRSFAENLGVSVITVETAYAQLVAEGYLYARPRSGYYVAPLQQMPPRKEQSDPLPLLFSTTPKRTWKADFVGNQTDSGEFPFSVWARLMRYQLADCRAELMQNPPVGGCQELRDAIARHLCDYRGMRVAPEQIIIGAGTEYLYGLLIQLLGQEKIYAVEDPGYRKIRQIYEANHVKCVSVPLDDHGVSPDALAAGGADILHFSPSHHFPTGIVTPVDRRYALLAWANEAEGRYLIEDDYDTEFRFSGRPIPAVQGIDEVGKVIYINTFTKTLSSTVRISYMILPPRLLDIFYQRLGFYSCTVSTFEQYTLAAFIAQGYFEKHINRMRNLYHIRRDLLLDKIAHSPLAACSTVSEEDAGLHFLLRIDKDLDDAAFLSHVAEQGIHLSALAEYYDEAPAEAMHTFVINYSGVSPADMTYAVDCLCAALDKTEHV